MAKKIKAIISRTDVSTKYKKLVDAIHGNKHWLMGFNSFAIAISGDTLYVEINNSLEWQKKNMSLMNAVLDALRADGVDSI